MNGGVAHALSRNPCGCCDKESRDNTSGDSTGIYLGVYDSLQVSSEPAGAGTEGSRLDGYGHANTRARRCTRYTEPGSKEQHGPSSRRSPSIGS